MRARFVEFADRILFGTDLGVGRRHLMLGSSGAEEPGPADILRFYPWADPAKVHVVPNAIDTELLQDPPTAHGLADR